MTPAAVDSIATPAGLPPAVLAAANRSYPGVSWPADDVLACLRKALAREIAERTDRGDHAGASAVTGAFVNFMANFELSASCSKRGIPCPLIEEGSPR